MCGFCLLSGGLEFGHQRVRVSEEKGAGYNPITCWGVSGILELLDVESLHSHGLALVPGLVYDGATAALA